MCPRKQTTEPKLLILVPFSSGEVTSYTDTSYCIHILWEVSCSGFFWATLYTCAKATLHEIFLMFQTQYLYFWPVLRLLIISCTDFLFWHGVYCVWVFQWSSIEKKTKHNNDYFKKVALYRFIVCEKLLVIHLSILHYSLKGLFDLNHVFIYSIWNL